MLRGCAVKLLIFTGMLLLGTLKLIEVFNFTQDDLLTEDIMILNTHNEVFVWIGQHVDAKLKQQAFEIGQKYMEQAALLEGLSLDTPLYRVTEGNEPSFFTRLFAWDSGKAVENEKKNIIAVQTLRNSIMGNTLMATTCILLCSGLAAMISSTYSVKKPLNDTAYGGHGELMVALKYVTLLMFFLFAFFCHSLSIRFLNQVNYLINTIQCPSSMITADYVCELFERGFIFNTIGNRTFYIGFPLLLWIFGPVLVFVCSVAILPVLYNLDFIFISKSASKKVVQQQAVESKEYGIMV